MPAGVRVIKWPHKQLPDEQSMRAELERHGYIGYDLQTIPGWFERDRHSHDYDEIRAAVSGVTTFHFDDGPVTIEAGDILFIPAGVPHEVPNPFSAFKGSVNGERSVTEHSGARGSVEDLARQSGA